VNDYTGVEYSKLARIDGMYKMKKSMEYIDSNNHIDDSFKSLLPDMAKTDPFEYFTAIPYEKGDQLLLFIE